MDLNLTASELQFRDEVRAWLEANSPRDWKAQQANETMEERFVFLRAWQRKVYEGGWAGLSWPTEYGGRGATLMEQVIFTEETARFGTPPMPGVLGLVLVGPTLITFGTEAQKRRYLPKILSGDEIWCQGFSEPNAGSDLAALRTEARLDGDHFVVNGQKIWTSYGWASDWCELVVRTDPAADKHKGLTVLLVDMHSPCVEVRRLRQMTGESEFNELFFENVRVPAENVVGRVNDGWNVALGTLMHERAMLGAGVQVQYRRQFERLLELARSLDRIQDPVVRQKLGQSYAELEIMRLNQMRAISGIIQRGQPGPEGSIQKISWSEWNQRFQQLAAEILGPYAQLEKGAPSVLDDGDWAYGFLRARGNTIEAGTSEIQRNIIGHFVLGLPKSY
ncbi:MAG: acyl-CoA dehydrogenase family protein [Acidobacteria bacterium]|nr:acyl-CoA dehydrogenase family protein [Acidobacteriota bacterium]